MHHVSASHPVNVTRMPSHAGMLVGVVVLTLASNARAQVVLDGWGTDGFINPPITLNYSTTGVTVGTGALQSIANQGSFWGPGTGNLIAGTGQGPGGTSLSQLAALQQATRISFDLTLLSTQINGGSGNFSGFAQANVVAFHSSRIRFRRCLPASTFSHRGPGTRQQTLTRRAMPPRGPVRMARVR